jgi:ribonuclease D
LKLINSLKIFFKPKVIYFIEEESSKVILIEAFKNVKTIAVDTEFIWRDTYFPKLSLVQIAIGNEIFILDCLKLNDLSALIEVLEKDSVTKIFHSVRGDASVLNVCLGVKLNNIFDTQIAENIISENENFQIGYKKLVEKYFYKNLSKKETNSNWEHRPLSDNQLLYAADDVRYLESIMKDQLKVLKSTRKYQKFIDLCTKEKEEGERDFSISRLKRFKNKHKKISSIEENIFMWREQNAKSLNIPPNKIFNEKNLKRLKDILERKNIKECEWIIRDDDLRLKFLKAFT